MKRWNGWGDESIVYPLPGPASRYLASLLGAGIAAPDASFGDALGSVPPSRLPPHPLITADKAERLLHARGQSLPDWIALRAGRLGAFPDGVAYPTGEIEVRALLDYARATGTQVIPYGGGTSVVGGITPCPNGGPTLTLDLARMNQLLAWDETSRLATFGAGVTGPSLEARLRAHGCTLGHFPQSWEYSTLGGWVATRSSGQQSYYYGRIAGLLAGVHVETPIGALDLPPVPASAAGPDLRQLMLGSEGRLGIITRATVRVAPLPEVEQFEAVLFRDWASGITAVREMAQARVPVSMLRLSDALETETTLRLAGHEPLLAWARRGLGFAGYGAERALLIFGATGDSLTVKTARDRVNAISREHGGLPIPILVGPQWRKTRFKTPYLRNTLWERGYATDTLETALPWSAVLPTAQAIMAVLQNGLAAVGERVLAFAHLSHVYADGASIYATFLFRRAGDPDETLRRWQTLKQAASLVVVGQGGTISHQHGVGVDHAPYLIAEDGAVGIAALEAARRALDPEGLLNPGKLIASDYVGTRLA